MWRCKAVSQINLRDVDTGLSSIYWDECLCLLQDNLLLDMYLAPHVKTLYSQIRNRALIQVSQTGNATSPLSYLWRRRLTSLLTLHLMLWSFTTLFPNYVKRKQQWSNDLTVCAQYFSPYVSADMTKMAQAFNTTVAALEDELTQLILEGLINARIDSHSKVRNLRRWQRWNESGLTGVSTNCCSHTLVDPLREGRWPEEHDVREVSTHGQRVSETSQSHDPPSGCAAQPDPCQGESLFSTSHHWSHRRSSSRSTSVFNFQSGGLTPMPRCHCNYCSRYS